MINKILVLLFFLVFANISHAEVDIISQAEKVYQDCLKENEAETCISGCGMILHSCEEAKQDFINQKNKELEIKQNPSNPAGSNVLEQINSKHKKPNALYYPKFKPVVANLGVGCRIKLKVPNTGKFTSGVASGIGAASLILSNPPYWNDDWFIGFTCYRADADTVPPQNDTVTFDNKKQRWVRNPANTDIIPEQHLKAYAVKTPNALGWAYTDDDTAASWRQFEFSGMGRSGGKMNAGFGDYSIMFKNNNSEYTVFQEWSDEDGTYNIGVTVTNARGKTFSINGLKKSQEGSLVLLEGEGEKIPNKAE